MVKILLPTKLILLFLFLFVLLPSKVYGAAGDYAIFKDTNGTHETNNTSFTGVPFNSQIFSDSIFTQNANDIDVDLGESGYYLYGYSVQARNDTYNKDAHFDSRVLVGGSQDYFGNGNGYRENRNNDRFYTYSYGLVEATAGDDIRVEVINRGNNASHNLEANRSSLWSLKLDDAWDYLVLQGQDNQSTTTSQQEINFTTTVDNTDTNIFGHSTGTNPNQITLQEAGHYLVVYNIGIDGAGGVTTFTTNLEVNGTDVPWSYNTNYLDDSSAQGATSNISIIDAAANDVLTLEWGAIGYIGNAQGTQTQSTRTAIGVVKIPDYSYDLRVYEAGGGQTFGGLNTTILYDTTVEADSSGYTYSTSTGEVTINYDGLYLFNSGAWADRASGNTGLMSAGAFYINGTKNDVGNVGQFTEYAGGFSSSGLYNLSNTDVVTFRQIDEGDNGAGDTFQAGGYGMSAINLDLLFAPPNNVPNAPQTPYANDDNAQSGQTTPVSGLLDLTPAFSAIYDDDDTSDTAEYYQLQVGDDSNWGDGAEMWDSTKTIQTSCSENTRCSDITYAGTTLSTGSTYYWRIKYWDNNGGEGVWSTTQQFSLASNNVPNAPQTPYANNDTAQSGQASPVADLTDTTPAFSAIYDDSDTFDTAEYYQLQVGDDTDWSDAAELWDSTKTAQVSCSENTRCNDIIYAGSALSLGTTYYWRVKFWDGREGEGSWSTTQQFSIAAAVDPTGDIAVYTDSNGTFDIDNTAYTGIPFNNQVKQDPAYTQNANDIDVGLGYSGYYLYGYSVEANDLSTNKSTTFLSRVTVGGAEELLGHGQGHRPDNVNGTANLYGFGITSAAASDDIRVEVQRIGNSNTTTVMEADKSSLWLLKLDDTWDYLLLGGADNQSTTTSLQNINFTTSITNTNTGIFSHSTGTNPNQITLLEGGHYLVIYNVGVDGASGSTSISSNLNLNSTAVPHSFDYSYIEGGSSRVEGTVANISIINAAANDVLTLNWGATGASSAAGTSTTSTRTGISIIRLPDYADYLSVYEQTSAQALGGLNTTITYDTIFEEIPGSYYYNDTNGQTTAITSGNYLYTSGARSNRSSTTSATQLMSGGSFYVDSVLSAIGNTGLYVRGDNGTSDTFDGGFSAGGIFGLSAAEVIDFRQTDLGDNGDGFDYFQVDQFGLSSVNLDTLFVYRPNPPQTPYAGNNTAQTGQSTPALKLTDTTPAFSAIFDDTVTSETSSNYQLQVGDDRDWSDTPELWDSGKASLSSCNEGNRCSDITYSGSTLSAGNTYYWRIKFWNSNDDEGAWSQTQEFSINSTPTVTSVTVNSGSNITLAESTTTTVDWTATVTDLDGYTDISTVTGKLYRSGVSGAQNCTVDDSNCYEDASCTLSGCVGSSCSVTCSADLEFYSEPTDSNSPYPSEYWLGYVEATDNQSTSGVGYSPISVTELSSLFALSVSGAISHGTLFAGEDTQAVNQQTTVTNQGNVDIDLDISGDPMCTDYPTCVAETIDVTYQEYSDTSFTYGSGIDLLLTTATLDINLLRPTQNPSNSSGIVYWGLGLPSVVGTGTYNGANEIVAVDNN